MQAEDGEQEQPTSHLRYDKPKYMLTESQPERDLSIVSRSTLTPVHGRHGSRWAMGSLCKSLT